MTIRTAREWTRVDPAHREILKKYRGGEFPVKLGALARDLGVEIKVSTMKPGISGGQITREDGKYVVRVNRHEIRERQRFTIAHELSHFLLHRDVIDSSPLMESLTTFYIARAKPRTLSSKPTVSRQI